MKPELHLKHKKRWKTDSQVVQKINMLRLSIANNKSLHVPVPIPGSQWNDECTSVSHFTSSIILPYIKILILFLIHIHFLELFIEQKKLIKDTSRFDDFKHDLIN